MVIVIVWIAFIRLEQKTNINLIKNDNFCGLPLPFEDTKILESNQYQKFGQTPFESNQYQKSNNTPSIIYADLEYFIKEADDCKNNLEEP